MGTSEQATRNKEMCIVKISEGDYYILLQAVKG